MIWTIWSFKSSPPLISILRLLRYPSPTSLPLPLLPLPLPSFDLHSLSTCFITSSSITTTIPLYPFNFLLPLRSHPLFPLPNLIIFLLTHSLTSPSITLPFYYFPPVPFTNSTFPYFPHFPSLYLHT